MKKHDKRRIKIKLSELYLLPLLKKAGEWLNMNIDRKDWLHLQNNFAMTHALNFDYLFCLTCVDWKTHLTMVYHFTSTTIIRHTIVVKSKLDRNNPEIETVSQYLENSRIS